MVTSTPENKVIITDSIPDYLHINTMLPRLLGVKTRLDQYVDYFLTTPNIELILKYNEDGSPVLNKIKKFFKIPDTLPVATLESPVITDTEEKKYAMKMAYWFYNKQQDFARHPDAKFLGFESFPGKVADGAVRVSQEVSIPVMVGTQGLSDVASVYYRPHSTGLYVAASEKIKITIPKSYLSEHLEALKKGLYYHDDLADLAAVTKRVKKYLANDPSYAKWSEDPFLALCMYIQIIDHFGWDAIIGANTVYQNLPKDQYPKTDQDKIDLWFETICKTTNSDLTRFFDVWKLPVSEKAKEQAKKYKSWFPKELE